MVLARNVSFPTMAVLWSSAGFPAYYFDEAFASKRCGFALPSSALAQVAFTITPTLPDGLDISSQNGASLAQIVFKSFVRPCMPSMKSAPSQSSDMECSQMASSM